MKEPHARLRALARYGADLKEASMQFLDLSLHVCTAALSCSKTDQSIKLGEKELRILEYMLGNQGQIMTRDRLAMKIWGI